MLNGIKCSCLIFRFSLPDNAVILEQIQTSYKIMPQMAETKLVLSVTEYYKQIKKPAASIKDDRNVVAHNPSTTMATF